ncbi:MAG: dioxygenase [Sedimenticola sp.]|nr:dioxygenase [Sedimenticola sp.]
MPKILPTLFLSHGAPDFILTEHIANQALKELGNKFPSPTAVVILSAHWTSSPVSITAAATLPTIHDFSGFPDELYQISYPAKGDPVLAQQIRERLEKAGIASELNHAHGLDHGAWIPLMLIYPEADIPVIQVSLPKGNFRACAQLGEALAPLRNQGILIIGSGGSVHNLSMMNQRAHTDVWAKKFEHWLRNSVEGNRFDCLLNPRQFTPLYDQAHPTPEHFAPLVAAWAAGNRCKPGKRFHHSFMYGNLGMAMYAFG